MVAELAEQDHWREGMELTSKIWPQGHDWPWPEEIFQGYPEVNWMIENGSFMEIRNTGREEVCFKKLNLFFHNEKFWSLEKLNCTEFCFLYRSDPGKKVDCLLNLGDSLKVDLLDDKIFSQEF